MKTKKWQVSVALVSIILGMLIAIQFQTQRSITETVPTRRVEELVTMLKEAKETRLATEKRVAQLKSQLKNAPRENSQRGALAGELEKARILAGMEAMEGPGIIVTLNENPEQSNLASSNNLNVVQDEDLLRTINELRAAGAEAISLNGQRIVATSEIRWAGSHILVNNTSISPPYEIKAIGDRERLANALKLKDGIIDTLSVWGIHIKVNQHDKVEVPTYKGALEFRNVDIISSQET